MCAKNDFYVFVPSDLDLWPLDLKFAPPVTLVQRCASTKWEVSMAFRFRDNRRHGTNGRTDGQTAYFMCVCVISHCLLTTDWLSAHTEFVLFVDNRPMMLLCRLITYQMWSCAVVYRRMWPDNQPCKTPIERTVTLNNASNLSDYIGLLLTGHIGT